MSRVTAALTEAAMGIALVAMALLDARILLQSRVLVYLAFPLLCTVALAIGWQRARAGTRSPMLVAFFTTLPLLVVALQFGSGRNKPFLMFPLLAMICVAIGGVLARGRMRASSIAGILAGLNVVAALAGPVFVAWLVPSRNTNEAPVPFVVHLTDGRAISSRDLRGNIVVLDFWATWCAPCQRELPAVQRALDRLKGRGDVVFFAVDVLMTDAPGDSGDTAERAIRYFRRGSYTLPLALDGGGALVKAFAVRGLPTLLVLDRQGRVRLRHVGFSGAEDLERRLLLEIEETDRGPTR
ncbi:MAG TPA: TlpA disulfide reductase family protein [Candidatus Eisenbacteria bacterium]|jgi:thiol-disulfide isomerase/thioredoxin